MQLSIWTLLLGTIGSGLAFPEPTVTQERVYYAIQAQTREQVWQQIKQNSPKGEFQRAGEHLINVAVTQWSLETRYQYEVSLTQCKLRDIQPFLHIRIHMPHWKNSWQADPLLAENWSRYVRMVSDHEDIHKQYAIKMVNELDKLLHGLGSFKRCQQLEDEVEKVTNKTISKYKLENAWFDAKERIYQRELEWF